MTKADPLTQWRKREDRAARKAKLSATYRATEPGQESPEAIEAMDELATMAKARTAG